MSASATSYLSTLLATTSRLSSLISSSYGPAGYDRMMKNESGSGVVVSNSGEMILQCEEKERQRRRYQQQKRKERENDDEDDEQEEQEEQEEGSEGQYKLQRGSNQYLNESHSSSLHHSHAAITRYLLSSLTSHTTSIGDGSSTVLLLLDASVRAFVDECGGGATGQHQQQQHHNNQRRRRHGVLRCLQAIQRHWISRGTLRRYLKKEKAVNVVPSATAPSSSSSASSISSRNHSNTATANTSTLKHTVHLLIKTLLGRKLSEIAVSILSTALTDLIFQSMPSSQPHTTSQQHQISLRALLHTTVTSILQDCPFYLLSGVSLSSTRVLNGFLIRGRTSSSSLSLQQTENDVRAVIVDCDLNDDGVMSEEEVESMNVRIETNSTKQTMAFLTASSSSASSSSSSATSSRTRLLQHNKVRLLFSSSTSLHFSPHTLTLLSNAGILVIQDLEREDVRKLEKYAGVSVVERVRRWEDYDVRDDSSTSQKSLPIFEISAITPLILSNRAVLHIEFAAPSSSTAATSSSTSAAVASPPLIHPHTLLICATSDAMTKQYESLLLRALRILAAWSAHESDLLEEQVNDAHNDEELQVVGGGGSIELSLLLFCEQQSMRRTYSEVTTSSSAAATTSPATNHILLPPEFTVISSSTSTAGSPASLYNPHDISTAFTILSSAFRNVLIAMLDNCCAEGATDNDTGRRGVEWMKMIPHLRNIHDNCGFRNFGFNFTSILSVPPPYTPLYHHLTHSSNKHVTTLSADALLTLQQSVAESELALFRFLPELVTVGEIVSVDASSLSLSAPSSSSSSLSPILLQGTLEPLTLKIHILSTFFTLLMTLCRVENVVKVKDLSSLNQKQKKQTNEFTNGVKPISFSTRRDRSWIRSRHAQEESDDDDHESSTGEESEASDHDT